MHGIYELKETLCDELEEYGNKGKLDVGGLEIVDKLAHTIKNLDKIIEGYEDGEYSKADRYMNGVSYARGRRRDSMGRYSRADGLVAELHELMKDAPDERTKVEFRKFIQKMEQM